MSYRRAWPRVDRAAATRSVLSPVPSLSTLTLGPHDRLVVLGGGGSRDLMLDWLEGQGELPLTSPPWRVGAIRPRVVTETRGIWPFRRRGPTHFVPLDEGAVAAGLRAFEEQDAEVLVVEDPPAATLDDILATQERTGAALVLTTYEADVARRAGGVLILSWDSGFGPRTTFESVAGNPPGESAAEMVGWTVLREEELLKVEGDPFSTIQRSSPGPGEIAPGHPLALAWSYQLTNVSSTSGGFQALRWSTAWGLPPGRCMLDPLTVPGGWVALDGRVEWMHGATRPLSVRTLRWRFPFVAEAAAPTEGTAARVVLDPAAARCFSPPPTDMPWL